MSTNSTASIVSWAPNPDGRGTIDLLWTCFATIFLCTWSAIHPNLPGLREGEGRTFFRRLGYVSICVVAPEFIASVALAGLSDAMTFKPQTPNWSLQKCYFLFMGGFIIQSKDDSFERYRPSPRKLMSLFEEGAMPWPDPSDDDIKGRSRADWFTKGIAMVQILYFVTSLVGRWAQGLAVTSLELFTLGIVVCAMITFTAWWDKPFDVQIPMIIFSNVSVPEDDCVKRVGFTNRSHNFGLSWWFLPGVIITCVTIGALHIAAWNYHFPSPTEQLLWRISSVLFTGLLSYFMLDFFLPDKFQRAAGMFFYPALILYGLVRIYMFVEMFASLRAVPESVYQTPEWSQYFPFLG